ncbi:hypothetical protein GOODEAATRI_022449 [Goodea atripinnis]|uniref:Uncharacterized protein n=1 Tax=Goodea atripinnis TaxID=208336 RepID=A0ABV0PRI6_9TELE
MHYLISETLCDTRLIRDKGCMVSHTNLCGQGVDPVYQQRKSWRGRINEFVVTRMQDSAPSCFYCSYHIYTVSPLCLTSYQGNKLMVSAPTCVNLEFRCLGLGAFSFQHLMMNTDKNSHWLILAVPSRTNPFTSNLY